MPAFARRQFAGGAVATTLTASINATDTTCSLAANTGWPSAAGVAFYVVIDPGTSVEEKCLATISGTTLTLTRGQDDTTGANHPSGAVIYPVFTANDADEANEVAAKLTTKGDLLATNGTALNRLAVGTNDQVLVADSAATNGVKWGTVSAAGLASDAVTTAKILDANVTTAKIADDAVTQAKLADRVIGSAEYDNLTLNAQTGTTYTLVLADAHKVVTLSNASSITLTVPPESSVAFQVGDQVNLLQLGAGQVTVAAGSGVTLRSEGSKLKLTGQYALATLVKIATDEWVLVGNLTS
jgi:hypothetical protein